MSPQSPQPNLENALIVVNPVSGKNTQANKAAVIQQVAKKYGWRGLIAETTKEVDADQIIKQALDNGTRHFIVCGGDGTVAMAAAALAQKPAVLGVITGGTANLFVKNMGLPVGLEEAIKTALLGTPSAIDVGVANGVHFTVIAGLGLDAQIIKDANRQLKDHFGFLAYVGSAIKNITKRSTTFSIAIDHQAPQNFVAKSVMVANLGKIMGALEVVPKTNPQSGTLQVGVLQPSDFKSWLNIFTQGVLGHVQQSNNYTLLEGRHVEIKCLNKPQAFECDGGSLSSVSEVSVDILPQSLWVMRP